MNAFGFKRVVIAIALSCLSSIAQQPATPAPNSTTTPLTTTAAVQALLNQEAQRNLPVRIRGVVTFSQQWWRLLFVEDATGGIFCESRGVSKLPSAGQEVEITGYSGGGAFLPVVIVDELQVIGPGTLPPGHTTTAAKLWQGEHDGDMVKISGQVISARLLSQPTNYLSVQLSSGDREMEAWILGETGLDPTNLPSALVEVRGVYGPKVNGQGQITGIGILAAQPDMIRVISNATEVINALPVTPITSLQAQTNRLVRTRGVVTFPGTNVIWLGDRNGGSSAQLPDGASVKRGDSLEVTGFVKILSSEHRLMISTILTQTSGQLPEPVRIAAHELLDPGRHGQVVQTKGEFLHRVPGDSGDLLVMREEDQNFEVRIRYPAENHLRKLVAGSRLQVSGILRVPSRITGLDASPRILVAQAGDLKILTPPPWPMRRTLTVVVSLAVALGSGLLALGVVHRRLRVSNRRVEQTECELRELNAALEQRIQRRTTELAASEARFRTLVEGADVILWEHDSRGEGSKYISPQAERLGYTLEQWYQPNFWRDHLHPEDREAEAAFSEREISARRNHRHQYRLATAMGRYVWIDDVVNIESRPDGSRIVRGVMMDITERKQAEEALRESEERFAKAFQVSPAITVITSKADARYIDVNDRFTMVMGYTREEAIGKTSLDLGLWVDLSRRQQIIDMIESGQKARDFECVLRNKAGEQLTMLTSIELIVVGGEPCLLWINHDITERKRAEILREEQNQVLELIAQGAPLKETLERLILAIESYAVEMLCSVLLMDEDGAHLKLGAAPSLPEEFNRSAGRIPIGPCAGSCGTAAFRRETVIVEDIETDPLWAGARHHIAPYKLRSCWSTPIFDSHHELLGTFAVYYQQPAKPGATHLKLIASATHTAAICIERHQHEAALLHSERTLRRSNELLQQMGQLAHIGAWSIDVATNELTWSEEVYRIHEVDLDVKPNVSEALDYYAPEARSVIRNAVEAGLRDGTPWDLELPFITRKGRRLWVRAQGQAEFENGRAARLHGAFQDITARKQAEESLRISEERFQYAMRGANDGLWDWNLKTDEVYYSPRWKSMLGYTDEELPNHIDTWKRLVESQDGESAMLLSNSVFSRQENATCQTEFRMRHKDGHWVNILSRAFLLRDAQGAPDRMVGTHIDMTDRIRAEQSLRESEERFAKAFHNSPALMTISTYPEGVYLDVNEEFLKLVEFTREEIIGHSTLDVGLWPDPSQRARFITALEHGETVHGVECVLRSKSGADQTVLGSVVRVEIGHRPCLLSISYDITRRKRTENALLALVSSISTASGEGFFRQLSRHMVDVFQTQSALVAEILPEDAERIRTLAIWANGKPAPHFEAKIPGSACAQVIRDGMCFHPEKVQQQFPDDACLSRLGAESYFGIPVFNGQRQPIGILAVVHDKPMRLSPEQEPILRLFAEAAGAEMERSRSFAALQSAEAKFRSAIEHSFECLAMTNAEGLCTYASPSVTRLLGYTPAEVINQPSASFLWPADLARYEAHRRRLLSAAGNHAELEFRVRHKDGSWRWVQTSDTNLLDDPGLRAIVSNFRDITERKHAEAIQANLEVQLRQSQKMEAIGTLAGGVAHDFNNILGAIIGCAELARRASSDNAAAVENLDDLLTASLRAKELIKHILAFSRREQLHRAVVQLEPVVEESLRLLRATLPATVVLRSNISGPVPKVLASSTSIQQVLMNLAANAAQAIGNRPGHIDIELTAFSVNAEFAASHPELKPGPHARIVVKDDGTGMEATVRERIFEPFFTTKGPGQGTGLGLSVVHGIIRSHEGAITVDSEPGVGTEFQIYLPAAAVAETASSKPPQRSPATPGRERILFVDDEPTLLKVSERILRQSGYQVTTCNNPQEAFEIFRQSPNDFDMVVTDYSMPGQTGVDLARQLFQIRSNLAVILCTGYGAGLNRESARRMGFREILLKPVEFDELCRAVRAALNEVPAALQP